MYFCVKGHIGTDSKSGQVHTVRRTSGNVNDVTDGSNSLLHGRWVVAFGDARYEGVEESPDAKDGVTWHVVMRSVKRKAINLDNTADALTDKAERTKADILARSRATVSGDQVPAWTCESALLRLKEHNHPAWNTNCTIEYVDGARPAVMSAGMSVHEIWEKTPQELKTRPSEERRSAPKNVVCGHRIF